jgi:hypothetical protein
MPMNKEKYLHNRIIQKIAEKDISLQEFASLVNKSNLKIYLKYAIRHCNLDIAEYILSEKEGISPLTGSRSSTEIYNIIVSIDETYPILYSYKDSLMKYAIELNKEKGNLDRLLHLLEMIDSQEKKSEYIEEILEYSKKRNTTNKDKIYQGIKMYLREDAIGQLLK